jgi:hypothetical protein
VKAVAIDHGVCVRPVPVRRIDLHTGEAVMVDVPCGATLASKCAPCAERAKRLRMAQCREGWHAETEPVLAPDSPTGEQRWLAQVRADLEAARDRLAAAHPGAVDEQSGLTAGEVEEVAADVEEELRRAGVRGNIKPDRNRRRVRSTRRRRDAPDLPAARSIRPPWARSSVNPSWLRTAFGGFAPLSCQGGLAHDGTRGAPRRRARRDRSH